MDFLKIATEQIRKRLLLGSGETDCSDATILKCTRSRPHIYTNVPDEMNKLIQSQYHTEVTDLGVKGFLMTIVTHGYSIDFLQDLTRYCAQSQGSLRQF